MTETQLLTQPATRRGAILLIEDRDDVRQGLAQLLELHGFLVADASTGEEAMEQLTSDPEGVALVLLYILFYYRALGLVVVLGLAVWGSLQWSVVALLGSTSNLALTLAGKNRVFQLIINTIRRTVLSMAEFFAQGSENTLASAYYTALALDNHPPRADFTADVDGLTISVDASGSTDPDGPLSEFHWDFGDGHSSIEQNPSHRYNKTGSYTVTLQVEDDRGAQASLERELVVQDSGLQARFTVSRFFNWVWVIGLLWGTTIWRDERPARRNYHASLPVDRAMTMAEAMRVVQWNGRISRVLLHGISTIALLLALVGLYAVTAHSVRLRRKELGIRLALGAGRREIAAQVLRRAMWQLTIGLAAGVGATIAFDRLFTTTAMRLTDPVLLLPTMFAIVLVGLAACLWPASRAVRLDPAMVLRDE